MSVDYEAAPVPVRPDLVAAHRAFWERLARPGTWWSGPERVAIAAEARRAETCALCLARRESLSPDAVAGTHDQAPDAPVRLQEPAREVIHRLVMDASRTSAAWYQARLSEGLTPEQYVEILGVVSALVSIDRFCRGLGVALHSLPEPVPGEPRRYRPAAAVLDGQARVPMIPFDNSGLPEADLWPPKQTGNVIRAMSLVPDEVRNLNELSAAHYLPNEQVRDPGASRGALSRAQMELVAGRVSALNQCFY